MVASGVPANNASVSPDAQPSRPQTTGAHQGLCFLENSLIPVITVFPFLVFIRRNGKFLIWSLGWVGDLFHHDLWDQFPAFWSE